MTLIKSREEANMATYGLSALQTLPSAYPADPSRIGVDVHKRNDHIALLRADRKTFMMPLQASPEAFAEQLCRLNIPITLPAPPLFPEGCLTKVSQLREPGEVAGQLEQLRRLPRHRTKSRSACLGRTDARRVLPR